MDMELSYPEKVLSDEFRKEHWEKCKANCFYMIDRSGGIGWTVFIHCKICNEVKNITDIGCW